MNKCCLTALFSILFVTRLLGQSDSIPSSGAADSAKALPLVTVHAYEQHGSILTTAAAVSTVNSAHLSRYDHTSILPAVNTIPGVRMEERSPGSYRFGIRGSALESPFGVRNIKVYYNGIPFTDPSGGTYLNQLGFYNMQSLEIIKGPGSSLYGAGTGGVLLINSIPDQWRAGAEINFTAGSYGLMNTEGEIRFGDSSRNVVRYQHLAADGYRQQSAMRNDIISWDAVMRQGSKGKLSAHFFYGDLQYQTPGGLTLSEYNADARQARPGTAATPGAIQAKATIYQQTFLAGFSNRQQLTPHWTNTTTLYGDYSRQLNPNLRNYSRTSEPNFGGRTVFSYELYTRRSALQWVTGAEAQQEYAQNKTYNNVNGNPQLLQADQEITNGQVMGFTQLTWRISKWVFTGGASINRLSVDLKTLSGAVPTDAARKYNNQVAPRIAALYRLTDYASVYITAEKGFSPPTISELAPTGSAANLELNPEQGWNYEAGFRGYFLKNRLYYDVNIFYFSLQQTIVQRRDSSGGDHYLNSGSTRQAGAEVLLKYMLSSAMLPNSFFRVGYSGYSFQYDHFVQLAADYSGKKMPGTPANTISAGAYLASKFGLYLDVNYYFCDRIALNDANTAFSNAYHLLGSRIGYKLERHKYSLAIFAGANNMLNQKYSLGNDINAVNGRYYNAAAPINYFAGLSLGVF